MNAGLSAHTVSCHTDNCDSPDNNELVTLLISVCVDEFRFKKISYRIAVDVARVCVYQFLTSVSNELHAHKYTSHNIQTQYNRIRIEKTFNNVDKTMLGNLQERQQWRQ